jgi:hypothetical protein
MINRGIVVPEECLLSWEIRILQLEVVQVLFARLLSRTRLTDYALSDFVLRGLPGAVVMLLLLTRLTK